MLKKYRKVLRLTAASKLGIVCFVFKFKELITFTPMYYFFSGRTAIVKD